MTAPADVRTYDESLLTDFDPTSLPWARTWVRLWLRDRPELEQGGVPLGPGQPTRPRQATWAEFGRTDAELNAALTLDSVKLGDTVFYRPHFTAARVYLGDPALWRSRSVDGSSETRRDPTEIVGAWLAQGRAFDALLPPALQPLPPFVEVAVGTSNPSPEAGPTRYAIPLEVGGL